MIAASTPRLDFPRVDAHDLTASFNQIVNRWPAVGFALGVVRNGRLEFFRAHGLADIEAHRRVTEDTVFRIASITKTFTAIAVMQLWERGLVDLDAPANDYLRAFKLVPAKASFRPATLRHLLTHTAGIREALHPTDVLRMRDMGDTVRAGRPVPSLAEYYRGGLRFDAEPGTRFIYTNHGFGALRQIVEDVTGQQLDRYFRKHIFDPLGMVDTDLVRSDRLTPRLAIGYELSSDGAKAIEDYETITVGGGGAVSTPRDIARYLAALMGGGANEHGSVLEPATLRTMFAPHYQPDPRIPGMGLGFWRAEIGGQPAVEHAGILPGFDSEILLAADRGVGVMAFANGARRGFLWLTPAVARVLRQVLGVPEDVIRTDVPQHPEVWSELCGRYRLSSHVTDPARLMMPAGAEVRVRNGRLIARALSPIPQLNRGLPLHPDDAQDSYAFRLDLAELGIGTSRLVFSRRPGGGVTAAHLDFAPLSFEKRPARKSRKAWVAGALGVAALGAAGAALRRARSRA